MIVVKVGAGPIDTDLSALKSRRACLKVTSTWSIADEHPLGVLLPIGTLKWAKLLFLAVDRDHTWLWRVAAWSWMYPRKVSSTVACVFFNFFNLFKHFTHTSSLYNSCTLNSPVEAAVIRQLKAAVTISDLSISSILKGCATELTKPS